MTCWLQAKRQAKSALPGRAHGPLDRLDPLLLAAVSPHGPDRLDPLEPQP